MAPVAKRAPAATAPPATPLARRVTVLAEDPRVRRAGKPLFTKVEIPAEELGDGPRGYRVQVIDYDATNDVLYPRFVAPGDPAADPFDGATEETLDDPRFHAFNAYALAMRTLARFEFALGRRVPWGFDGHVLKIAPHAFADANAFFDPAKEALLFGYFTGKSGATVHTALSHDVVVHETTHALLGGLRERYLRPSSPDQAAFHEGFADVVALLSVFSLGDVVESLLDDDRASRKTPRGLVRAADLKRDRLVTSVLFSLATQVGEEMPGSPGGALRRSAGLEPGKVDLDSTRFREPHARGEVLVACVLNALADVWSARLEAFQRLQEGYVDRQRAAEEGAKAAGHLLTMCIRAIDYLPPVHVTFSDFLSALLTADAEMQPDDSRYEYRRKLVACFGAFGIRPASHFAEGRWGVPEGEPKLDRSHFESLVRDPIEVFRYVWENQRLLSLNRDAYTEVISVRPCWRSNSDGFIVRETVAEYRQVLKARAGELGKRGTPLESVRKPKGLDPATDVYLEGGTTLIFDEYGRLKFAVGTGVASPSQTGRLEYLHEIGALGSGPPRLRFGALHRSRALGSRVRPGEVW